MRSLLILAALVACKGGGVSKEQEVCAKAAAMFEKCEDLGSGSEVKLESSLTVDRWRGLCRAVLTGETKQLMPNALELYNAMDDGTKAGLRQQAECTAKATTCSEYAACSK